ncbi:hypothetical protein C6I20_13095 [Aeromicrobium sp. A1-2]|uniref:hypothetical protein n=1 Tax=Aeromicrobium sp. A1-2 TaxID=2107713 RepID=UPI000E4C3D84|nr:hypothetical protein [Aeromicrobium sp. A1-2]AXT86029.1 hypothetical protein C6I20_13095 [Aeromicrobium sp. A1-2]
MPDDAEHPATAGPDPSHLSWSRHRQLVALLLQGATWRVSSRASLLVGTLLTAVNQGDQIVGGTIGWVGGARIAANYAIPYMVAGVGFLSGYRTAATR